MASKNQLTREEKDIAYSQVVPVAREFRRRIIPDSQVISDTFKLMEEQLGYFILRFPSEDD